jgi:hypothetical protein
VCVSDGQPLTQGYWKKRGLVYQHDEEETFFTNTVWLSSHVQSMKPKPPLILPRAAKEPDLGWGSDSDDDGAPGPGRTRNHPQPAGKSKTENLRRRDRQLPVGPPIKWWGQGLPSKGFSKFSNKAGIR